MAIVKPVILEDGQLKTAGVGDQVPQAYVQGLDTALGNKVDKVSGKGLSDANYTQAEKTKLNDVAVGATKNRVDTLNADKVHTHTTAQVTGLDTALAGKTDKTTQVIAGTGLTGGGTLAANRTLAVTYGTTADTAAQGNDSRITGALQSSQVVQVTGASTTSVMSQKATTDQLTTKANTAIQVIAGTGLTGGGTLAANRTLNVSYGTAAGTAAQGNDSRLSDSREWSGATISQAEAEAGTVTTRRAFTAQRVRQAIVAWFNGISGELGRTILARTAPAQVRADIGLGAVDNTSDADKPVSTAVADGLALKVDKVAGKGLSDTNFTQAEKAKLSSLEGSKFVGLFVSESALPVTGSVGDYANVDGGVGSDVYRVIWDSSDNKWVKVQGVSTALTGAQIKQQYEGNPDTNAFTDEEKTKLTGVAIGATKNRVDTLNADKVHTHTTAQVTGLDTALAGKTDKTTQVIAGTGLTGGGTLAANRTLAVTYGTTADTAAQGNDTRIINGQTAFGWGSHASAGYAKTKADVGLSGIPNTNASTANFLRGDGTWVTPPNTNTTYAEITVAEIDAGTASTLRTISGRRMQYALDKKADTAHEHSISDVTGLQVVIDSKANTSTQVIAGTGLTGGGNLTANRTLNVSYGTAAGTAAQGNDSRITGALQTSQVAQVTGTSTTNVMSQKATTDAIANIPSVPKSSSYTVTAANKGASIDTTANVTIPASVFAVGDVIVVTNTSATDSSITAASGVTIRLAGSDSTGVRTLAGYGVATLRMVSSNVWFASGAGLS